MVKLLEKLQTFSLALAEMQGIDLEDEDIKIRTEEGNRSLLGKVYKDKRANFVGVKSSMLKLWQHRGTSNEGLVSPSSEEGRIRKSEWKLEGDRISKVGIGSCAEGA